MSAWCLPGDYLGRHWSYHLAGIYMGFICDPYGIYMPWRGYPVALALQGHCGLPVAGLARALLIPQQGRRGLGYQSRVEIGEELAVDALGGVVYARRQWKRRGRQRLSVAAAFWAAELVLRDNGIGH